MPDLAQGVATEFFRTLGYGTIKSNDGNKARDKRNGTDVIVPLESGRSDMIVFYNRSAVFVEVKNAGNSLPFKIWRENQRQWAEKIESLYKMDYWLFIEVGEGRRGATSPDHKRAYLIPRIQFHLIEANVIQHQNSMPLDFALVKRPRQMMKYQNYSVVHVFRNYELQWQKASDGTPGHYTATSAHPFLQKYPAPMQDLRKLWQTNPQKA